MHVLIHIIVLFIFVLILLMVNIPKIDPNSHIRMKLYIFIGVFVFEFVIRTIFTIFRRCLIDINKIVKNSLQIALIAVVAYSIYNDLVFASNSFIVKYDDSYVRNLIIALIIVIFIILGYLLEIILTNTSPKMNDCLNTIYHYNTGK